MPAPSEPQSPPEPRPRRRRRWLRVLLKWGGLLLLLVLVFHRPLLRWGVRYAAQKAAASQGLTLDWKVRGSITGGVEISGVSVSGGVGHWLPRATLQDLSASYDLITLLRRGPGDFLEQVRLHDAEVELDLRRLPPPAEKKPEPEPDKSGGPAQLVWPRSIDLKNLSARVTLADGTRWEVRNLTLQTGEGQPGLFRCDEIRQVPGNVHLTGLGAAVQIRDRRLTLQDLGLPEDITVRSFAADLEKFGAGEIGLKVELESGSARSTVDARVTSLQRAPQVQASVHLAGLSSRQIPGLPAQLAFESGDLSIEASGSPADPHSLAASAAIRNAAASWDGWAADRLDLQLRMEKGIALLDGLNLTRGANQLTVKGMAYLPPRWADAGQLSWSASANATLPDPQSISPQPLPVQAAAALQATASGGNGALQDFVTTLTLTDLVHGKIRVPRTELQGALRGTTATLDRLLVSLGGANSLQVSGRIELSGARDTRVDWNLNCPDAAAVLEQCAIVLPAPVQGSVQSTGRLSAPLRELSAHSLAGLTGDIALRAEDLRYGGAQAGQVSLALRAADGVASLQSLRIAPAPDNSLEASARVQLQAPWTTEATAEAALQDLGALRPLFMAAGMPPPVTGGAVRLSARAAGTPDTPFWKGDATLTAEKVRTSHLPEPVSASTALTSDGEWLTISRLEGSTGAWNGELSGRVSAAQADISSLRVREGAAELLTGRAVLPFAALQETPAAPPLDVSIASRALNLAPLTRGAAEGKLDAALTIRGTLQQPEIALQAALKEARVRGVPPELSRSAATLQLDLREGRLSLGGQAHQPPLQPLVFSAQAPVQLAELRRDPQRALDIPFDARADLPRSGLAFLRQFAPETIREVEGTAALSATLRGTVRQPDWDGDVTLDLPEISFVSASLPGVKQARADIRIRSSVVQPDISALLAGGKIGIGGTVTLTDLRNPVFSLTLNAREALALRDRSTSLRANADLSLTGPLQSARLAGTVEAVRGRVFKELEFLPLSLPDDLPPPPPAVQSGSSSLSFGGPLAGMAFDVKVRTKDPIRLMGNIMNGAVIADAHLGGTGAAPLLTGAATFDDTRLMLPFSQMKLVRGKATIDPAKPMEPQLDIRGESRVGEYAVTLYVFGSAFDPQLRFVSVPPLSEPDIAVLLATGAPLAGSAQQAGAEATGRALFLLASQTYRKLLGRTGPRHEEPPKLHLSFNPSSGLMGMDGAAILADYDLTDRLRLSGSAAQSGNMRVMLSWLIRFGEPLPPPALRKP